MEKNKPVFNAYVVTEKHRKSYWTKVGVVFAHQDGEGFNVVIPEGIAVSGQITIRKPKVKDDPAGEDQGEAFTDGEIPI